MNDPSIPSLWSFISQASPIVKTVLVILLGCSILSWTIILQRSLQLWRVRRASQAFFQVFWSGIDLPRWLQQWQQQPDKDCMNGHMIASGLQELNKLEPLTHLASLQRLKAIQ